MSANAINNANIKDYCESGCIIAGFIPALTYVYNAAGATVTVTDASTLPAGDALAKLQVKITDEFGGEVRGTIAALAGNTGAISVATLNRSKALNIQVTLVTTKHIQSVGSAWNIGAAGSVSNWDSTAGA